MPTPPERYVALEDLTVEELIAYRASGELPETDEYREYVAGVHRKAGIEPPDGPKSLDEMTPEDHARRKYPTTERTR